MISAEMREVIDSLWKRQSSRATGASRELSEIRASYAPVGQLLPMPDDITGKAVLAQGVPAYWLSGHQDQGSPKTLMFVHGGGYSLGSLRSHGPLAARLGSAMGRRVLFPEYRLAPENPFPAALDDTVRVWRWLVYDQGIDPADVIVGGDSAGGGLALALIHTLRDTADPLPSAAILLSPFLDLTASGASMVDRSDQDPVFTPEAVRRLGPVYLNGADPLNPSASPLFAPHVGLPPLFIQVGGAEVLLSDSTRLAEAAAAAGVEVTLRVADGLPHVYQGALHAPEAVDAVEEIAKFARQF